MLAHEDRAPLCDGQRLWSPAEGRCTELCSATGCARSPKLRRTDPQRQKSCGTCHQMQNVWTDFAKDRNATLDGHASIREALSASQIAYVAARRREMKAIDKFLRS